MGRSEIKSLVPDVEEFIAKNPPFIQVRMDTLPDKFIVTVTGQGYLGGDVSGFTIMIGDKIIPREFETTKATYEFKTRRELKRWLKEWVKDLE